MMSLDDFANETILKELAKDATLRQRRFLNKLCVAGQRMCDYSAFMHVTGIRTRQGPNGQPIFSIPGTVNADILLSADEIEEIKKQKKINYNMTIPLLPGQSTDNIFLQKHLYDRLEQLLVHYMDAHSPDGTIIHEETPNGRRLTTTGRAFCKDHISTSIMRLTDEIMQSEEIREGGLLRIRANEDNNGLCDIVATKTELDPDYTWKFHCYTPTRDIGRGLEDAILDMARAHATIAMAQNMASAKHPNFSRIFRECSPKELKFSQHDLGYKTYTFTEEGRSAFSDNNSIYSRIFKAISDALMAFAEKTPTPLHHVYVTVKAPEPEDLASKGVSATLKPIYLIPATPTPVKLKVFPIESVMDREFIELNSLHMVETAIYQIIAPHMWDSGHPLYPYFFRENEKKQEFLTNMGADALSEHIRHISSELAEDTLSARLERPDHYNGGVLTAYYVFDQDDTIAR